MQLKDAKLFRQQAYIDGTWLDADSGQTIKVNNPATGEIIGTVPKMGTAETRRDLGWDPPADAYEAASFLSECIAIASKHAKLDDRQRKEAERLYTDAALKLLREAMAKGFADVARLKTGTAMAPLRPHPEFQKLLTGLEAKGK